jgi:hypothetical protein
MEKRATKLEANSVIYESDHQAYHGSRQEQLIRQSNACCASMNMSTSSSSENEIALFLKDGSLPLKIAVESTRDYFD